ncbi:hypothetical protein [Halomarina ordinaria]|uniref:Uncharacterized protein n=1 Tax=Halomarina ordinaria TaxID=3033939 RepID=A0ABD5UBX7_9EURY|nr:hypothetical protein [Halomarina sp. PSRA2]
MTQDTGTLEDVFAYCEARVDWQTRNAETDELAETGEAAVDTGDNENSETNVTTKVPCGEECGGCPHPPHNGLLRSVPLS